MSSRPILLLYCALSYTRYAADVVALHVIQNGAGWTITVNVASNHTRECVSLQLWVDESSKLTLLLCCALSYTKCVISLLLLHGIPYL